MNSVPIRVNKRPHLPGPDKRTQHAAHSQFNFLNMRFISMM
jgi:hypothetical protein